VRAGALAVYRRAGHRAATGVRPPAPAGVDHLPEAPVQATRILRELTERRQPGLLREAFERLGRGGHRLPATGLPAVLDLEEPGLADVVGPVLGERGRWLARFRPEWAWAVQSPPDTTEALTADAERVWQEGSVDARRAALRAARAADPERARAWVESAWDQEKSDQRAEFLRMLSVGLSAADEAFLERALDDRSQAVRTNAAELLATLPGSALAGRVADRADSLLSYRPPPPGGAWARAKSKILGAPIGALDATPPSALDAPWARDGIPPKPPKGIGARAHWLASLLALVPPARWEARFGATAAELISSAWAGDWGFAVAHGWSRAALLFGARAWVAPLWDAWLRAKVEGAQFTVQRDMLRLLLPQLDRADAEARALDVLHDPPAPALLSGGDAVDLIAAPWSEAFARAYLDAVGRHLEAERPTLDFLRQTGPGAALALPPACFAQALDLGRLVEPPSGGYSPWKALLQPFTDVVELRRRIHEEIPT
jgi:hypothetical protein